MQQGVLTSDSVRTEGVMKGQRTKFDNKIRLPLSLQLLIIRRPEVTDVKGHAAAGAHCRSHPVESKRRRRNSQGLQRTKQISPVAKVGVFDENRKGNPTAFSCK